ncbi:MAG: four helix bundle protein [Hyphomicrobiales bacterium]|nr:four helix bundle protein [Hyphomicrobiales bacterium]
MSLAERCYQITTSFPNEERCGLTAQTRRSAVSIAANIAEGHGRETTGAFVQFLRNAQGSLKELETHLMLACRVHCVSQVEAEPLLVRCEELGRMLRSLIRSLQRKIEGTRT